MKTLKTLLVAALAVLCCNQALADDTWKFVVTGASSTYGIKSDGTLWSWGWNTDKALAADDVDPSVTVKERQSTPVQISTATDWVTGAAGQSYAFFIKEDGTLWALGNNAKGVGGGQKNGRPTQLGTDNDWVSVACARFYGYFAYALKKDGTLWSWGEGETGALGRRTTSNTTKPTLVGTAEDKWKTMACGNCHVLAIREDGTLWGWGWNGQYSPLLGLDDHQYLPAQLSAETDWVDVFAVGYSSYAIKADGSLWAWGNNDNNTLGLNVDISGNDPDEGDVPIVTTMTKIPLSQKVAFISGDADTRVVGLGENGVATKVIAWGSNADGALGDGKGRSKNDGIDYSAVPVDVKLYAGAKVAQISCGQAYTIVRTVDGIIYGWGRNLGGQLGESTPEDQLSFYTSPILAGQPYNQSGHEYVVDGSEIPGSLRDATKLTLVGTWDTASFGKLTSALGNATGFPPTSNTTLVTVDMSMATIAEGTSLYVNSAGSNLGAFKMCSALTTVIMPAAEQCKNFTSLREAFWLTSLESIDLDGCENVTDLRNAFNYCTNLKEVKNLDCMKYVKYTDSAFAYCSSLKEIKLPGSFVLQNRAFGGCTALETIDWSAYCGTTDFAAEKCPYLVNDLFKDIPESQLTIIVPDAAYESFAADARWSKYTIVNAGTTGITDIPVKNYTDAPAMYNLQGQRIPAAKGLVIIKGKKFFVK